MKRAPTTNVVNIENDSLDGPRPSDSGLHSIAKFQGEP